MLIIKVNLGGKFYDVELSKEECEEVKKKCYEDNLAATTKIYAENKDKLPIELIAVLCDKAVQHWNFRVDSFAKYKIYKKLKEEAGE